MQTRSALDAARSSPRRPRPGTRPPGSPGDDSRRRWCRHTTYRCDQGDHGDEGRDLPHEKPPRFRGGRVRAGSRPLFLRERPLGSRGRRPGSSPGGASRLRDSAGFEPDFARRPLWEPIDHPAISPGAVIVPPRTGRCARLPTLAAMAHDPRRLLAGALALVGIAAWLRHRPVRAPLDEGAWSPAHRPFGHTGGAVESDKGSNGPTK